MKKSMMRHWVSIGISWVVGSASLPLCAQTEAPAAVMSAASDVALKTPNGEVGIEGTHLMRDGTPWTPHGFYQIAFEVPPAELPHQKPFWTTAQQHYAPAEYTEMKQFGADSVRIQVAQPGMDPKNPRLFSASFQKRALDAIRAARAAGLTVIVSVQDEPQTGDPKLETALPDDATQRVWQVIAPAFAHDRGVLYELFNEPHIGWQATVPFPPADWPRWRAAMNRTISTIREAGARNVVIADGLQYAQQLKGAPPLDDPMHQVAYAAHPYSLKPEDQRPDVWQEKFGEFAAHAPVMISEWGIGYFCNPGTPQATTRFMQYLDQRHIGMIAGAWDWQSDGFGSAMYDFPQVQPSSFVGPRGHPLTCFAPNQPPGRKGYRPGFGFGKLIATWYRTGVPSARVE